MFCFIKPLYNIHHPLDSICLHNSLSDKIFFLFLHLLSEKEFGFAGLQVCCTDFPQLWSWHGMSSMFNYWPLFFFLR
jgi:hypothetical protein